MRVRAVLDTNVVISGLINPQGAPGGLLDLWITDGIAIVLSPALMKEMLGVIGREKFDRLGSPDERHAFLVTLFKFAEIVFPHQTVSAVTEDEPDNRVLEAAVIGKADLIISGDGHLLALGAFQGIPILDPATFLARQPGSSGRQCFHLARQPGSSGRQCFHLARQPGSSGR